MCNSIDKCSWCEFENTINRTKTIVLALLNLLKAILINDVKESISQVHEHWF